MSMRYLFFILAGSFFLPVSKASHIRDHWQLMHHRGEETLRWNLSVFEQGLEEALKEEREKLLEEERNRNSQTLPAVFKIICSAQAESSFCETVRKVEVLEADYKQSYDVFFKLRTDYLLNLAIPFVEEFCTSDPPDSHRSFCDLIDETTGFSLKKDTQDLIIEYEKVSVEIDNLPHSENPKALELKEELQAEEDRDFSDQNKIDRLKYAIRRLERQPGEEEAELLERQDETLRALEVNIFELFKKQKDTLSLIPVSIENLCVEGVKGLEETKVQTLCEISKQITDKREDLYKIQENWAMAIGEMLWELGVLCNKTENQHMEFYQAICFDFARGEEESQALP